MAGGPQAAEGTVGRLAYTGQGRCPAAGEGLTGASTQLGSRGPHPTLTLTRAVRLRSLNLWCSAWGALEQTGAWQLPHYLHLDVL